jgi:hypothetical protein
MQSPYALPKEVAEEYRVSLSTVYNVVKDHPHIAIVIRGQYRICRAEFLRLTSSPLPSFAEHCDNDR